MNQKRGYTILELLIYTALLALLLAVSSASAISLYRFFGVTRIERQIALEGDTAMEIIIRDIRNATSTNVSSVFGSHPGTLVVGDVRLFLSGATLQRSVGAGAADDLTAQTRATNFLVYYATSTSFSNNAEIITVRVTLEAGRGFAERSRNFFGSAVVRGSY